MEQHRSVLYAIIVLLLVTATTGIGQSHSAIGTFDIEKVRKAASGSDGALDSDTGVNAGRAATSSIGRSDGMGWIAARIGLYLALIVGAIFLVVWLLKRCGLAGGSSKIGGGSMDLLEALAIGPNRAILLVRVKDAVFVLAQTQNQITLLDKVEGNRALELISSSKGVVSISQFKDAFNGFMGKIKKPF